MKYKGPQRQTQTQDTLGSETTEKGLGNERKICKFSANKLLDKFSQGVHSRKEPLDRQVAGSRRHGIEAGWAPEPAGVQGLWKAPRGPLYPVYSWEDTTHHVVCHRCQICLPSGLGVEPTTRFPG